MEATHVVVPAWDQHLVLLSRVHRESHGKASVVEAWTPPLYETRSEPQRAATDNARSSTRTHSRFSELTLSTRRPLSQSCLQGYGPLTGAMEGGGGRRLLQLTAGALDHNASVCLGPLESAEPSWQNAKLRPPPQVVLGNQQLQVRHNQTRPPSLRVTRRRQLECSRTYATQFGGLEGRAGNEQEQTRDADLWPGHRPHFSSG